MLGSTAVEVVIGIILMYLLLSLLCTIVNEGIATLLGLRAKTLAAGIEHLFDDANLRGRFQKHGLIQAAHAASGGAASYVPGETFALALIGCLDPSKPLPLFADIRSAALALPQSAIKDVLLSRITAADDDLDRLRIGLGTWFDGAMDRVGGIYKRKLKLVSLLVGIALACTFGADTIDVATHLWREPAARAAVVKVAERISSENAGKADQPSATESSCEKIREKAATATNGPAPLDCLSLAVADLRPLPIGWHVPADTNWAWWIVLKVMGLLFTGLALSLGAPFWFDLLGKIINIRGAGPPPERTAS